MLAPGADLLLDCASVTHSPQFPRLPWAAFAVAFLALTGLYWDAIHTPFMNDDFLFLVEARTRPLSA